MGHFAKVCDGKVLKVVVGEQEFFDTFVDTEPGDWIQTSYNTRGNVHYGPDGQPDGGTPLRGNYAGIGYIYDHNNDVFYPPKPFASWVMDSNTWTWVAPIPEPADGKLYGWDEENQTWVADNGIGILNK